METEIPDKTEVEFDEPVDFEVTTTQPLNDEEVSIDLGEDAVSRIEDNEQLEEVAGDAASSEAERQQGEGDAMPGGEAEAEQVGEAPRGDGTADGIGETAEGGEEEEAAYFEIDEDGEEVQKGEVEDEKKEEEEPSPAESLGHTKGSTRHRRRSGGHHFGMLKTIDDEDLHAGFEHDDKGFIFEMNEPEEEPVWEYLSEEEESSESEIGTINRPMYYERFKTLDHELRNERIKSHYLQKRVAEYYKRRRMLHVLRESVYESDTQAKYDRKLDALHHLLDISTRESERIQTEESEMRRHRDDKKAFLTHLFQKFQKRELAIGQELLNTKGPRYNVEGVVQQYLKHQRTHLDLMIKMRMANIKAREKVNEKQEELKKLDNLGDNLHLIDYEQLKMDVRNNSDKLEEKDAELVKIRERCRNSMQVLAHISEKSAAYDADIDTYNEHLDEVTRDYDDIREQLLNYKQDRDDFRAHTNQLRADSGLLTKPVLLRDMEDTLDEVKASTEKLQMTKDQYSTLTKQVAAVRMRIEICRERKSRLSMTTFDGSIKRRSKDSRIGPQV